MEFRPAVQGLGDQLVFKAYQNSIRVGNRTDLIPEGSATEKLHFLDPER